MPELEKGTEKGTSSVVALPSSGSSPLVDKKLEQILQDGSLDNLPKYCTWLKVVGLTSVRRFAARCDDESQVESVLVDKCNSDVTGGVVNTAGDIAAIKLAWKVARDILDTADEGEAESADSTPMTSTKFESLQTKFQDWHKFKFTIRHVLTLTVMNTLYKCAKAVPPQFCVLTPDELKLRASITK